MRVYLAHQITGLTPEQVIGYYESLTKRIASLGLSPLCPMTAKGYFRTKKSEFGSTGEAYAAEGYTNPASTNHAIFERDKWMVQSADIVLVDLTAAKTFSIGCVMELAMASVLGKHTIVVMDGDNPHHHAFVLEAADILWPTLDDAIGYLGKLANQSI